MYVYVYIYTQWLWQLTLPPREGAWSYFFFFKITAKDVVMITQIL